MFTNRTVKWIKADRRTDTWSDTDAESTELFAKRAVRPRNILSFVVATAILCLVFRQILDFDWSGVWLQLEGASYGLLAFACAVFYSSFLVRTLRWQVLLHNVGYSRKAGLPMPSTLGLTRIMYLSWFANCITVARLGDAYRGYLLRQSAGVSLAVTLGTVLAERILDLAVLMGMLSATILVTFHRSLPAEATSTLITGLLISAAGVFCLVSMRHLWRVVEQMIPVRLHSYYERFEHGTVDSFRRVPLLILCSAIGWVIESTTLYIVAAAVGAPVSISGAVVTAFIASLLSVVPFTPSGLGVAEAGMVLVLRWLGLDMDAATAVAILDRLITYWSIVFLGFAVYVFGINKPVKASFDGSLDQDRSSG